MSFIIRMGVPEMEEFWQDLKMRAFKKKLSKNELRFFKKLSKAFFYLSQNPQHSSLNSHEISALSSRLTKIIGKKIKVWQSYLENNTPAAGRVYWCYAPQKGHITVVGVEPHPEDKKRGGYNKVNLSNLPPVE